MKPEKEVMLSDVDVKIETYRPIDKDIQEYLEAQRGLLQRDPKAELTLNQYLKNQYFYNKDVVVTADLSNRTFSEMDLSGGDFTGCVFKKTSFKHCNLSGAVFCDVELDQAYFEGSILKDIDFRGADLETCQFSGDYAGYSSLGRDSEIAGIKFSTTASLARQYADIQSDLVRKKEQQDIIVGKEKELNAAYKKLTYTQAAWVSSGRATGNKEYDKLAQELKDMKVGKFPEKDLPMHKTFQNVFGSSSCTFDPAYVRGSTKEERDQEVQYVKLTRKDVEEYLAEIKKEGKSQLSLNDFAKSKSGASNIKEGARVVADCSSSTAALNNQWDSNRLDLSGLRFEGADLSGAVFAGSNLSGCQFYNTKISKASFESADLQKAWFKGVKAENANFFNANLEGAEIRSSGFNYSFLSRSNGEAILVNQSNFDYSNVKKGKWDHSQLSNSTFNHANLEGISLISASLRQMQMKHAILNQAVLNECEVIESDLSEALMNGAKAEKAKFQNTVLEGIEAKGIDLSDAELDSLTKLDGADLQLAVLRRINAEGVSFIGANMDMVDAQGANLKEAILKNASVRFANLTGAILEKASASGINASNSILKNVKAKEADFSNSVMRRIKAESADFKQVDFTEADLTGSKLVSAMLEKVNLEKARLEAVNLEKAKLASANLNNATVDSNTNMTKADMSGVTGGLIQDGKSISPTQFQLANAKPTQSIAAQIPSISVGDMSAALGLVSAVPSYAPYPLILASYFVTAFTVLKLTNNAVNIVSLKGDYDKWAQASSILWDKDLLIENKPAAMKAEADCMAVMLGSIGNVLAHHAPGLRTGENFASLQGTVIKYSLIPVLNNLFSPIPYISAGQAVPGTFDMFNGVVDEKFISGLGPLAIDLVYGISDRAVNDAVQSIYKNSMIPTENSGSELTQDVITILSNPKVSKVLTDDLVRFLENDSNKVEITKMAAYVVESRFKEFRPNEFFKDTVSLAVDGIIPTLTAVPSMVEIYTKYREHQDLGYELSSYQDLSEEDMLSVAKKLSKSDDEIIPESDLLSEVEMTSEGGGLFIDEEKQLSVEKVVEDRKKEIEIKQNESILSILVAANNVVTNVSPIFKEKLPEYLTKNKEQIVGLLDTEAGKEFLKSYGMDTEFTKEALDATIPFVAEALPILVGITENCLKDKKSREELAQIINNAKAVMNTPQSEQKDELKVFVESLIDFQSKHPEVKDALENQIPTLLEKHAPTLGPVIEEFLNETDVGKKLKLRGEKVLEALTPHIKDIKKIVGIYSTDKGYSAMVRPILNILSDPKVLSLIAASGLNLFEYHWQKSWVSNSSRQVVGEEISNIMLERKGNDLSAIFRAKLEEVSRPGGKTSNILEYSLRNNDLHGLSFESANMKLNDSKIKGFNFDDTKFGDLSFKDATLENCSFKGTEFKNKVNFDGVTIDAKTLQTLVPAIEKYNEGHKSEPISLDKIKIKGELSSELKDKPLLFKATLPRLEAKEVPDTLSQRKHAARILPLEPDKTRQIK